MESAKNHKVVYTIVERQKDGKKFWVRIGAAFQNQDGSTNVHLDAMPTNGTLQIREYEARTRDENERSPGIFASPRLAAAAR